MCVYIIFEFTLKLYLKSCNYLCLTYFNLKFCSKFVLLIILDYPRDRLVCCTQPTYLLFDCSYIHWMICILIFFLNAIKESKERTKAEGV